MSPRHRQPVTTVVTPPMPLPDTLPATRAVPPPRASREFDARGRGRHGRVCVDAECGADTTGSLYLCPRCVARTAEMLARLWVRDADGYGFAGTVGVHPCLLDELDLAVTRQAKLTDAPATVRRGHVRPLPYEPRASEILAEDTTFLVDAARHFGAPILITRLRDPRAAASWLSTHLTYIAGHPDVATLTAELDWRIVRATRVIDRPPATWYAGHCAQCGDDLYAEEGAAVIKCRRCGMAHDVGAQRARLLEGVEDRLATASEISRAVHLLERPISVSMIDNWHARGQLMRRGHSTAGHHLYRIGDVLDLAAATPVRAKSEKSRRNRRTDPNPRGRN